MYNYITIPPITYNNISQYQPCQLPSGHRNYTIVDKNKVDCFVSQKEAVLPYLADILTHSNNEAQIVETLHIVNSMLDNGVKVWIYKDEILPAKKNLKGADKHVDAKKN